MTMERNDDGGGALASALFSDSFYSAAEELSAALVRVEAVWADRFQPSYLIFMPTPNQWGLMIVDGIVAGLRPAARPYALSLLERPFWVVAGWTSCFTTAFGAAMLKWIEGETGEEDEGSG